MLESFFPVLGDSTEALIRGAYGVLMVATLLQMLPEARRFLLSDRWGGYAKSAPDVDAVQNPVVMPILFALWMASAVALVGDWRAPWPALVNAVLCRYVFIHMRWKGILRGMGAPGFLAYWLGLVVCLLEVARHWAPGLQPLVLLVAQVDLAFIMLSAGIYKMTAGYPRNHGMELGLCNPMWGYWWRWYSRRSPDSAVFWIMNQLAWGTEVVAAILMLIPATRELGALLIVISFLFIATQIRLGFLCEMVMVAGLLYCTPDGILGSRVEAWHGGGAAILPPVASGGVVALGLQIGLWSYLALLPFAHAGLYYNFYARRRLPGVLQRALERYTNLFGIIIWRVFSVDLVNFFIRIWRRHGDERTLVGRFGSWPRFNHVGEMICLTSLFTTLKYYPGNDQLFRERVLRYARTVQPAADGSVIFEYVSVIKEATRFDWVPVGEFEADPARGTLVERGFDSARSPHAPHQVSPLHAGQTPGSYAPVSR